MKLGVDLDDVVAVCALPYLRAFAERFGVELPDESQIGWHLLDDTPVRPHLRDEFRMRLYDSPFFGELDMYEDCPVVLERIVEAGHEVYFVTARAEKRRIITETWLREKGLMRYAKGVHLKPRGDFTPTPTGRYDAYSSAQYKARVATDLGLDAFCEDDRTISCTLAEAGIRVFLFDRPWNRDADHPNITRVSDWEAVARELGV
ncbi:MAG TPA: hypothetical protein VFM93_00280 [Candidatus Limnocylindria bacterium]|nr:hypothetical protein [Candidatus Limnocylindria bacterium]